MTFSSAVCNALYENGIPRDLANLIKQYYSSLKEGDQYRTKLGKNWLPGSCNYVIHDIQDQLFKIKCCGFMSNTFFMPFIIYGFDKLTKLDLLFIYKARSSFCGDTTWADTIISSWTNKEMIEATIYHDEKFRNRKLNVESTEDIFAIPIEGGCMCHSQEKCEFILKLGIRIRYGSVSLIAFIASWKEVE